MSERKQDAQRRSAQGGAPRTEWRMVADSWRALREDLMRGAFAFRPVPVLPADTPWLARVPEAARPAAQRLPRIALVATAVLLLVWDLGFRVLAMDSMARALVVAVPVAMLALRPVGAYWLSLGSLLLAPALYQQSGANFPYNLAAVVAHLIVLLCVAWRSRPRTALPLWALTSLTCAIVDAYATSSGPHMTSGPGTLSFLYGAALLVLLFVRTWRESRQEVVAQSAVVREERSLRTQLEERTVIARELHDVVAHHMSVVAIQAEAAPYRVQDPPEELVKALATIRENAVTALAELRRVLGVVRADLPSTPEAPQPTLAELDALVANVRASGRDAELVTTGAVRSLPPGLELSAYRIVQESLSNVLRHAPVAPVRVELAYVLGGLGIRVANEPPSGPSSAPSDGGGQGIRGMKERATLLGGELTAGAREDGGWDVEAFLPVGPTPPDEPARAANDLTKDGSSEAHA